MSRRPIVAVITNLDRDAHYMVPGYPRITVNEDYPRSIIAAGGVPLLLPPQPDTSLVAEQLAVADALILAGGADVDPLTYGQDPIPQTGTLCPTRDEYEFEALRQAFRQNKPVFAICRGMQILNVWLGGTLHQDNAHAGAKLKHWGTDPALGLHRISVEPDSFLDQAWSTAETTVNSYHHQCLDRVADGLRVVARAHDGLIEAVELAEEPGYARPTGPVVAVQWHPEMMTRQNTEAQALFTWFLTHLELS